jgi:hypothetical protein
MEGVNGLEGKDIIAERARALEPLRLWILSLRAHEKITMEIASNYGSEAWMSTYLYARGAYEAYSAVLKKIEEEQQGW